MLDDHPTLPFDHRKLWRCCWRQVALGTCRTKMVIVQVGRGGCRKHNFPRHLSYVSFWNAKIDIDCVMSLSDP